MPQAEMTRRALLAASSLLLFQPSNAGAMIIPPPNLGVITNPGEATCSISKAITALAGSDESYRRHLEDAHNSFTNTTIEAENALREVPDDQLETPAEISGERIEAIQRFATPGINDGIEEIATYREYYEFIGRVANACAEIVAKVLEAPSDVSDSDIVNLFGNVSAINLLNGTLVGFSTATQ